MKIINKNENFWNLIKPNIKWKTNLLSSQNKYVFKVDINANKLQIKAAIENLNKAWEPIAQKMYQAGQQETPTPSNGSNVNADETESKFGEISFPAISDS